MANNLMTTEFNVEPNRVNKGRFIGCIDNKAFTALMDKDKSKDLAKKLLNSPTISTELLSKVDSFEFNRIVMVVDKTKLFITDQLTKVHSVTEEKGKTTLSVIGEDNWWELETISE